MSYISIENVTKDYGHSKGIFDISFAVNKGEVFGYLGPNGAGKTTTIRNLLGFIRPDQGHIYIDGNDTWAKHYLTNKVIGYLPGEINLPSSMNGEEVLRWNREL
ncbi:MAG: ATP-binding cassette domain-containing protein, partial [Bacilli bacterium]|nr:ATP-binding cassette domain-containing protein [Bacilli bacterium]